MAAVKAPAGAGAVEVTYRFDDQPAVREQWGHNAEGVAVSIGAADPILDGLATAGRLVFRVGRDQTEIVGLTDFGADAVAAFLRRCEPPPA